MWVAYFEFNQNWACPSNAHTHARTSRIFAFVLLSFWMVFFRPALALHGSLHGIVCLVYVQNNTPLFRGNDRRQIVVDLANVAYSGYLSFTAADPCIEGLVIRGALEARRCGAGDFGSTCCCPLLSLHSAGTSAAVMVDIGRCDGECGVFYFIQFVTERCNGAARPLLHLLLLSITPSPLKICIFLYLAFLVFSTPQLHKRASQRRAGDGTRIPAFPHSQCPPPPPRARVLAVSLHVLHGGVVYSG